MYTQLHVKLHAVILAFCLYTMAANNFVEVSVCPSGPSEWQNQEQGKKCQDPTPDYVCAAIRNGPGHYGEICTKLINSRIPSGACVVLSTGTYELDTVVCRAPSGCPDTEYNPKELYQWPVCYGDFYGTDRNGTVLAARKSEESWDSGIVTGVVIVTVMILLGAIVSCYILNHTDGWKLPRVLWNCTECCKNETANQKVAEKHENDQEMNLLRDGTRHPVRDSVL